MLKVLGRWPARDQPPAKQFIGYLLLLIVVAGGRLLELRHSRRNERRAGPITAVASPESFPPMVALHIALFILPPAEIILHRRRYRPGIAAPALVGLLAATALRVWAIQSLGSSWNVRGAVPSGIRVVTSGPYRFVRHPNYDAVVLEMAALPLSWPAPLSALLLSVLNLLVLASRIRAEEQLLRGLPGYQEAMRGKKRFLPGLF